MINHLHGQPYEVRGRSAGAHFRHDLGAGGHRPADLSPLLFCLVLLSGCAMVFFQVAYTSYLPGLYGDPDNLHRGNARLALSESVSKALGPMAAGPVIGALGLVLQ